MIRKGITKPKVRKYLSKSKKTKSIFMKSKYNVDTSSSEKFRKSISKLKKGGLKPAEHHALKRAQKRSAAQLLRPNLSPMEKRQFKAIVRTKVPKPHKKFDVKRPRGPSGRFI